MDLVVGLEEGDEISGCEVVPGFLMCRLVGRRVRR